MKFIKIFLASSICELREERLQLSDFIRVLNDNYVQHEIYFQLIICENLSTALHRERKQQQYNDKIAECQYFYVLFGENVGKYTEEEFQTAFHSFRQTGAPKIYAYFRQLPDHVAPSRAISMFMKKLDQELGHYYSTFAHIDEVKLNILLELTRDAQIGGPVILEDGHACVNGNSIMRVNEIPVYQKNDSIQALVLKCRELEAEYAELIELQAIQKNGSELIRRLIEENTQKRSRLQEQLHGIEKELLKFYSSLAEKRQVGAAINWREKKAIELIDRGDYEGAKAILRDGLWKLELAAAETMLEYQRQKILEYISGKRTLIQAICATGITAESIGEIISCYEEITALAKKYRVEMRVLYEYADFLMNHNRHNDAAAVCRQLDQLYAFSGITDEACAKNKYLLACILYKTNDLVNAERLHREALAIRAQLYNGADPASMAQYAISCNQLGYLLFRMGRYSEARKFYMRGMEVYRTLTRDHPKYRSSMALLLNNLGILEQEQKDFRAAETYFQDSMKIRRQLAEDRSNSSLGFLAMSCLNYAKLLTEIGDARAADVYYREAIELYEDLCGRDVKFKTDLAIGQYDRARALEKENPEEAVKLHEMVLQQRLALLESNPDAVKADAARSYFSLGRLLAGKKPALAETYLRNAYKMLTELYQKAPEKFGDEYRRIEACVQGSESAVEMQGYGKQR